MSNNNIKRKCNYSNSNKKKKSRKNNDYYESIDQNRSFSCSSSSNDEHNDEIGHYYGSSGDLINKRYEIVTMMGKGTFGKVLECHDRKHNDKVAVKVIRSVDRYIDSARIEAEILDDVYNKQKTMRSSHCVKMYSHFSFNGHYCMVFEPLGISLYDLVKRNNYKRLPLSCVRDVSRQLLQALEFLRSIHLIHTDLKLENVLFTQSELRKERVVHAGKEIEVFVPRSTRIKVIDFGGATYIDDVDKSHIINTRQYRGPEVTLESGWSYPSDIWSAGCIVCEIYSGELLFETHEELEHLALIERIVGPFPRELIERSPRRLRKKYFCSVNDYITRNETPFSSHDGNQNRDSDKCTTDVGRRRHRSYHSTNRAGFLNKRRYEEGSVDRANGQSNHYRKHSPTSNEGLQRRSSVSGFHESDRSNNVSTTTGVRVRIEDLDGSSRRYVSKARLLKDYFHLAPDDASSGIQELVQAMLQINPSQRATAKEALDYSFVTRIDS